MFFVSATVTAYFNCCKVMLLYYKNIVKYAIGKNYIKPSENSIFHIFQ